MIRNSYLLVGLVQGVGLRPALYRAATRWGLSGSAQNCSGNVCLVVEGRSSDIDDFVNHMSELLPMGARLDAVELLTSENISETSGRFEIIESGSISEIRESSVISTTPLDTALCKVCKAELRDSSNRRFGYPFITCTDCGPRYSILDSLPYDRARTSMVDFLPCKQCSSEYYSVADRRFRAENISCPDCGPSLVLCNRDGVSLPGDPVSLAQKFLSEGRILAVKGLGGFQLALNAKNCSSVMRLRELKSRPRKPFAIMASSLEVVKRYCEVSVDEEHELLSPQGPIVILRVFSHSWDELPRELSPDTETLGVMLPTTPLHELLFSHALFGVPLYNLLVMTSGNRGREPMHINDQEAFEHLSGVADYFLMHNRRILRRDDDSVVSVNGQRQIWRKARGFAPHAMFFKKRVSRQVLAVGSELKNTVALAAGNAIYLSPYIGDLRDLETIEAAELMARELPDLLHIKPEIVARDLHPDLHISRMAERLADAYKCQQVRVQHHHAHALSCMAEHDLHRAIALVFDGLGYGEDGTIWGAELMYCEGARYDRLGTFSPCPLPGGDKAVIEPLRQLSARLSCGSMGTCGINALGMNNEILPDFVCKRYNIDSQWLALVEEQINKKINCPLTHAAGRVFDAFSVLLGACPHIVTYDGQAAICLESLAMKGASREGELDLHFETTVPDNLMLIDWSQAFIEAISCIRSDVSRADIALSFHRAMANAALQFAQYGAHRTSCKSVVLSGGVFMNRLLVSLVVELLANNGFSVYLHRDVPPNDGGISVGQAYLAALMD